MKDLRDMTSRQYKALVMRPQLRCAFCPPNQGENRKGWRKHGVRKKRGHRRR